jgi:Holliday junction resolvasome RuvABC ATP-dependent DNA helicase subunit
LVPVDPFASLFRKVQQSLIGSESELIRPDTLAICAHFDQDGHVTIYLTPVEIKFRESLANDASLSDWLKQAAGFGDFLRRLWSSTPPTELWGVCAKGLLAHILNYGMRIYGDEQVTGVSTDEWATRHESMLAAIYSGRAEIVVNEEGRLAVFDTSTSSRLLDLDNDGLRETLVVCRNDARAILERNLPAGSQLDQAVERWQLCGAATEVSAADEKDKGLVSLSPSSEPIASTNSHEVAAAATAAPSSATEPAPKPTTAEERGGANETPTGLVAPEAIRSTIPAEVREKVAQAFEGFIGNGQAVDSLKRDLLRALIDKPPHLPKNYLFVGNPSTGKTELARRVAAALQLPFVRVDGRTVTSREKLFELIDAELRRVGSLPREVGTLYGKPNVSYPPLIVFVDEVQLVARAVQESFLTLLESQDRTVVLERSVATLQQATHLFATTRSSELDAAFRSRCTEVYLHPYSETEVAEMLARQFPAWPPEILRKIARYGRSVPRIALELAKELETEVLVSEFQDRSLDAHLEEVRRTRGIDDNGLGHLDLNYLELLERSGPLGEQRLLSMLGSVDRERILTEVEPHLVKRLKLVQMTPKGRELTDLGRRYMAKVRKVGH